MLLFRSKNSVILGTMHSLPEVLTERLKSTIPSLVQRAERLILECVWTRPSAKQEPPGARLAAGIRLDGLISPDLYLETLEAGKKLGIEAEDLATSSPWWLAERLETASTDALGHSSEFSAEAIAIRLALSSGKEIRFLEAAERGYRCRSEAPLSEQVWALEFVVRRAAESMVELQQMVEAFESGELSAWEKFLANGHAHLPQTTDCMFRQRNLEWLPTLNSEFSQGKALVIVGALHLVSEAGVLALLEKSGRHFHR
jgi:uncharacterized protein YbaP (TraB family)